MAKRNSKRDLPGEIPKYETKNGKRVLTKAYENEVVDVLRFGWPVTQVCKVYGVYAQQLRELARNAHVAPIEENEEDD